MARKLELVTLVGALVLVGGFAEAETLSALRDRLGPTADEAELDGVHYLALTSGGVVVVDAGDPQNARVLTTIAGSRPISSLLLDGRTLFLIEQRFDASPFDLTDPRAPRPAVTLVPAIGPGTSSTTAASKPEPAAPPPQGTVLEVAQGRVLIDGGTKIGFGRGKRVRVISQQLIEKPDLLRGGSRMTSSNETSAVIEIEESEASRSMAILGRGDVAAPGDLVVLTEDPPSERLAFPRRAPYTVRAGFHARPFLGLATDAKPVGILLDAYVAWVLPWIPMVIEAQVSPAGLVVGGVDRHNPITMAVTGGWITDFFEIGLGAGALVGVKGPCYIITDPPDVITVPAQASPNTREECEVNSGLTFNQTMRLGSVDGLNLIWRSSVFSRPERFVFGMGRGELNLPLTSRFGMFGAGGGGENGWAFGELGVRTYTGGAGARGTLILSASLGITSIFDGPSYESVTGPSVAFGMEWRL